MSTLSRAVPETQLEVDLLILDYLLYMGSRTMLQEQIIHREEGIQEHLSEHPMRMIDSFIPLFKCNHPTVRVPDDVNFRLRLIKFISLYNKRKVPCEVTPPAAELEKLRRKHRRRAEDFYDSSSDSSFSDSLLEQRMGHLPRRQLPKPRHDEERVSLADLVPMFIGLSAYRANLFQDDKVSAHEGWMELTGEFMLQAALEQCLEYSNCSSAKLREIFSWGWRPTPTKADDEEEAINDMFCDDDVMDEIAIWTEIRSKYISLLKPKANTDLAKQLRALTKRFPIDSFEENMLHFLEAMQLSIDPPLLAQLETGNVEGFSKRQVEELKQRIRLPS